MNKLIYNFPEATKQDRQDWRWQFRSRMTRIDNLPYFLAAPLAEQRRLRKVTAIYPLAITPYYLSLIDEAQENDPIKAQCFPDYQEIFPKAGCKNDPLEEDIHMPVAEAGASLSRPLPGHRYRNLRDILPALQPQALLVGSPGISLKSRLTKMIHYVSASPQIREVIISGGDPLTLDDEVLEGILASLRTIPHVEVLRIGSRIPVVMPMRVTRDLCRILKRYRPLWFNTQFNHPREITADSVRACNMLQEAGIPVSNQSVLLKGINDSATIMKDLLYGLQRISVRPYYLFHCDPARGCAHFRTDYRAGLKMMDEIWRQCSGLCLPQYVVDVPGRTGKIPLNFMSRAIKKDLQKHQHFFDKLRVNRLVRAK